MSTVPSHENSPTTSAPNDPHTVPHLVDSLSQSNALKLPQPSTLEKWKKKDKWLVITERNTMICKICVSQKEKILLKNPSSQMALITGTTNFKASALKHHMLSDVMLPVFQKLNTRRLLQQGSPYYQIRRPRCCRTECYCLGDAENERERENECQETDGHSILHRVERKAVYRLQGPYQA